jgi:pilus assembly protein CpaB
MRAGEPLLSGSLEGADTATFSAKVREGIRAITIAVDEVNSLSGMLQPGDRIDLLLSVRMPAGSSVPLAQEVTRPLMQDLRVLATGRQVRPGNDERNARAFTAITVEVSPVQAQKLVVAQRIGKLTAMLRNPRDRDEIEQRPMDVYGLLGMQPVVVAPATPAERPPEIIVGGQGALKTQPPAAAAASPGASIAPPAAPLAAPPVAPSVASSDGSPSEPTVTAPAAPTAPPQPTWMLPPSRLLRPGAPR